MVVKIKCKNPKISMNYLRQALCLISVCFLLFPSPTDNTARKQRASYIARIKARAPRVSRKRVKYRPKYRERARRRERRYFHGIVSTPESTFVHRLADDHGGESPGVAVDLRRRRRRPPGVQTPDTLGGDSAFHVEAERRRASGCRTDAGASNPRGSWWGVVANAVPDGSPRRCNAFRRLRPLLGQVARHVTATIRRPRVGGKRVDRISLRQRGSSRSSDKRPVRDLLASPTSFGLKIRNFGDRRRDASRDYDRTGRRDCRLLLEIEREILKCVPRSSQLAFARLALRGWTREPRGIGVPMLSSGHRVWC